MNQLNTDIPIADLQIELFAPKRNQHCLTTDNVSAVTLSLTSIWLDFQW